MLNVTSGPDFFQFALVFDGAATATSSVPTVGSAIVIATSMVSSTSGFILLSISDCFEIIIRVASGTVAVEGVVGVFHVGLATVVTSATSVVVTEVGSLATHLVWVLTVLLVLLVMSTSSSVITTATSSSIVTSHSMTLSILLFLRFLVLDHLVHHFLFDLICLSNLLLSWLNHNFLDYIFDDVFSNILAGGFCDVFILIH